MIKGLDDDEVEFLDLVDRTKLAADRKKEIEEEQELRDYRNRVSILQEKSIDERLQADIVVSKPKVSIASNLNQQKLLKGNLPAFHLFNSLIRKTRSRCGRKKSTRCEAKGIGN